MVRDPLDRLLAVWTDRVQGRREFFNSRRLRRHTRLPPDPDPDFFFQNLRGYVDHASVVKHHALPVRLFVGPKPLRYDRVFRIEDLSDLAGELGRIVGRDVAIPRFNESSTRLDLDDLAGETQAALADYLAEDYAHLSDHYDSPFR